MKTHVINTVDAVSLLAFEEARDFNACKELLSRAISNASVGADEDMQYELGAAHLRLAIYQLVSCEPAAHSENMNKANDLLPRADLLALTAGWLDRVGENDKEVLELCTEFFDVAGFEYNQLDPVSGSYFEAMEELRARLSVGR